VNKKKIFKVTGISLLILTFLILFVILYALYETYTDLENDYYKEEYFHMLDKYSYYPVNPTYNYDESKNVITETYNGYTRTLFNNIPNDEYKKPFKLIMGPDSRRLNILTKFLQRDESNQHTSIQEIAYRNRCIDLKGLIKPKQNIPNLPQLPHPLPPYDYKDTGLLPSCDDIIYTSKIDGENIPFFAYAQRSCDLGEDGGISITNLLTDEVKKIEFEGAHDYPNDYFNEIFESQHIEDPDLASGFKLISYTEKKPATYYSNQILVSDDDVVALIFGKYLILADLKTSKVIDTIDLIEDLGLDSNVSGCGGQNDLIQSIPNSSIFKLAFHSCEGRSDEYLIDYSTTPITITDIRDYKFGKDMFVNTTYKYQNDILYIYNTKKEEILSGDELVNEYKGKDYNYINNDIENYTKKLQKKYPNNKVICFIGMYDGCFVEINEQYQYTPTKGLVLISDDSPK